MLDTEVTKLYRKNEFSFRKIVQQEKGNSCHCIVTQIGKAMNRKKHDYIKTERVKF